MVPKISKAPKRPRSRAEDGIRDLWDHWRADRWRRRRGHRCIGRLHHGLAGSRGGSTRIRRHRRRVGHRWLRSGLAGQGQRTACDDHAGDSEFRGVDGWRGALAFGHEFGRPLWWRREGSTRSNAEAPDRLRARLAPSRRRRHLVQSKLESIAPKRSLCPLASGAETGHPVWSVAVDHRPCLDRHVIRTSTCRRSSSSRCTPRGI